MADPADEGHETTVTWYGCPFQPGDIGLDTIITRFVKLARRRAQGKAEFVESRNRIN